MKAVEILYDEHEQIMKMLNVIETMISRAENSGSIEPSHLSKALDFLRGYADACHHAKEENMLFPALESAGIPRQNGPIGIMLHDHVMGRNFISGIAESMQSYNSGNGDSINGIIDNARSYILLLRNHIEKENKILFPMVERVLSSEKLTDLADRFEAFETEEQKNGNHSKFEKILSSLESIYPSN